MQDADLIIALGARFDDRVTGNVAKFAPQAKIAAGEGRGGIVHFEIMPKNINKVVQANEAVEGDVAENLALLLPQINKVDSRPEWAAQIKNWKERLPFNYEREGKDGLIKPQTVISKLSDLTANMKEKTIITTGTSVRSTRITGLISGSRCRSASDVGSTALSLAIPTHHDHFRRFGYHGLRSSRGYWCQSCRTRFFSCRYR